MDKAGMMGEILEKGQSAVKTVKKQVTDTAKAAVSQVAGDSTIDQASPTQVGKVDENFVKDLYGIKDKPIATGQKNQPQVTNQNQPASPSQAQEVKKAEDKQKLAKLRQELHMKTYFEPTFNPPKQKPEERPAEKVEQEKKEEKIELHEKEKKKPPPIVQKAQQRVEKFPGASG
ncbi:MAG: hypothetical protein A2W22_01205 [Candidatus Levybacteria bacterium RBG_16_35_11]|nr:MAG: hypothetical protein A2W22_01205 [Candidatus Levybacteria bacterium RBG_16_35_11]